MRYAIFTKASKLLEQQQILALHKRVIKNHVDKKIKVGFRLMYRDTKVYDQDGENFIKNLLTIISEFDMYKIPRFIKHFILRKK